MSHIGKRIKQRREELSLSQEQLAQKLGYKSRSTIAKIESGENDIAQSKIDAFAKALDVSPGFLMGWEDFNDNLIKINLRGVETWLNNQFFSSDEREAMKMHFAGLLQNYKGLINLAADYKLSLKDFEKYYSEYNKTLNKPLNESEIKQLFWKDSLSNKIDEINNWMNAFTSYLSGVYKNNPYK